MNNSNLQRKRDWNLAFATWSLPLSDSEDDKCSNSVTAIRKALDSSQEFQKFVKYYQLDFSIESKGSFRDNTNIRKESDVDLSIICRSAHFPDFSISNGHSHESLGLSDSIVQYSEFRAAVEAALISYFGKGVVKIGNKAINIRSNTYRVSTDVVPCFEHRCYLPDGNYIEPTGIEFEDRGGKRTVNWPEQTNRNGIDKYLNTRKRFKSIVRILKNLRLEMQENGIEEADNIASFLIQSLVWNTSSICFSQQTFKEI